MKKFIVLENGLPKLPIYLECMANIPSNAIEITDEEESHYLSNEYKLNGEWVKIPAEPIPLEQVKTTKLSELKQARDTEEVSPLNNFDVDEKSLSRIDIASKILATGSIPSLGWTMADNTVKEVTSADFNTLYVALATRSNELHEKYRVLKEKVNACKNNSEVEKIKW